jgi:hypothetical protein
VQDTITGQGAVPRYARDGTGAAFPIANYATTARLRLCSITAFVGISGSYGFTLQEVLDHMHDCGTAAWLHPLLVAPSINPFDELRLDADINVCGFTFYDWRIGHSQAMP